MALRIFDVVALASSLTRRFCTFSVHPRRVAASCSFCVSGDFNLIFDNELIEIILI